MKVTIGPPTGLTDQEKEEAAESARDMDDPKNLEDFKEQHKGINEIVIPEDVKKNIEAMGMTVDEFVAMFLKHIGKSN